MASGEPVPEQGAGSPLPRASSRGVSSLPVWLETVLLLALALLVVVGVKTFLFQSFSVPSESMEPLLQGGAQVAHDDRIVVSKIPYWFAGEPSTGDVVVFEDPGGWLSPDEVGGNGLTRALAAIGLFPGGGHLVKRVIGVEGDTVSCCDAQGRLMLDGESLDEPYAQPAQHACGSDAAGVCYGPMPGVEQWTTGVIPPGELFVMGDNREHSADSSFHLCTEAVTDCHWIPWVPEDSVVGKVEAIIWPLNRITGVS